MMDYLSKDQWAAAGVVQTFSNPVLLLGIEEIDRTVGDNASQQSTAEI